MTKGEVDAPLVSRSVLFREHHQGPTASGGMIAASCHGPPRGLQRPGILLTHPTSLNLKLTLFVRRGRETNSEHNDEMIKSMLSGEQDRDDSADYTCFIPHSLY